MKTTYVSTQAMANATRRSILHMQSELTTLQKEVSTGRVADVGLALGARAGRTVTLRQESASLQAFMDANASASTRLSTTQAALATVASGGQSFLQMLIDATDSVTSAAVTQQRARESLASFIDTLNSAQNGEYVFAGINSDAKPISDYSDPASLARQAVADAFMTRFGFAQGSPAVAGISASDMQDFLDTDFAALFDEPAWSTNWSSASDQPVSSRVSATQTVTTGATANDPAIKKLAMAYTMVSDLGLAGLSNEAYRAVVAKATDVIGGAIAGVTSAQAQLGYSEQAVADANSRMSVQKDVLEIHIGSLEGIDPYEATVRINNLLTQIETSYALTARIQQLSLLDFL